MSAKAGNTDYYDNKEVEKEIARLVELAVKAAAKGENVDHLQEVMISQVPPKMREALKQKFAAALGKQKLKQPTTDVPDVPSRNALSRIRKIFMETARLAMQRVTSLLKSRPDLAAQVKQVGQALAQSGVALDKNSQVTEADLGNISPTAGIGSRGTAAGKGK